MMQAKRRAEITAKLAAGVADPEARAALQAELAELECKMGKRKVADTWAKKEDATKAQIKLILEQEGNTRSRQELVALANTETGPAQIATLFLLPYQQIRILSDDEQARIAKMDSNALSAELYKHGLPVTGSKADKRARLMLFLVTGARPNKYKRARKWT